MKGIMRGIMVALLIFLASASCTHNVHTASRVTTSQLKAYKTYAFLPPQDTSNSGLNNDSYLQVRKRAKKELDKRGYILEPQKPDFLVLLHVNFQAETNSLMLPSDYAYTGPLFYEGPIDTYYYPYYSIITDLNSVPDVDQVEYTFGTVVIDIIDTKSQEIVWRGYAAEYERGYEPDEIVKEVSRNVGRVLHEFPKSSM
ncbi:MAG TPA: DUF4136 domain-containing protein [Cytophagaceae bacterium]